MASTIKDVAKMADVSISTVSRVINDSKPVSPEARRRVLHAIEVLDYKPNEVARSLVTKKSNLIGIIVSDIGNYYISQVLRGVEEIGRMYNYDILLSSSYGDPEVELKFAKLFSQKQVEGIIVISEILNQKLIYKLDEFKIPYLVMNRFYNIEEAPTVSINNKDASYKMTNHLLEMGHKKICYIALRKDMDRTNEIYKIKGYRQAMIERDLDAPLIYIEGTGEEDLQDILPEILAAKKEGVTAFYCTQDLLAIHLLNAFRDHGIDVPGEVSVCGFGGSDIAGLVRPRLTTVKEPYYDIGAVAIRRLLKTIEMKGVRVEEDPMLLPVEVIKRDSVKELS